MGLRLSRRALIGGIGPVLGTVALSGAGRRGAAAAAGSAGTAERAV